MRQESALNDEQITRAKNEIVARFGQWTAHNIRLGEDVYTIGPEVSGDEIKLRRILQIVSDVAPAPLSALRILDLACLEGLYAVEFARHGASVVAIEGREANIAKARFAGEVLSLPNLEFHRDDVRNLDTERYGTFDVVLCLGILYHLDAPDLFRMIAQVASVCKRFVVLDTHVSADARECREHRGRRYWGCAYEEHAPESDIEERLAALWSSLDNPRSFWLTKPSLYNALAHASFTSIYECHYPVETGKPSDRVTLLALKGERQTVRAAPLVNAVLPGEWPEEGNEP